MAQDNTPSHHDDLYERIITTGAGGLSPAELLLVLLGADQMTTAQLVEQVLAHFGGLHGLARATPSELMHIHGLDDDTIMRLTALAEITRRLMTTPGDERPILRTSEDAARLVFDMTALPQEHIRVILVDTTNRVIAIPTVYIGTVNMAVLRASEIYREAITRNAPAIILVHNHPSGDPTPSPEDVQLTRRLLEAGDLLDIVLLDHIIIGGSQWRSLRDMGLGF